MASGPRRLDDITIRSRLRPGDLGRLIALHGMGYADLPGFGPRFEAFVARTVADFGLENDLDGRIWLAEHEDQLLGCTAIARRGQYLGQLRWVLVAPAARGLGLGRELLDRAMTYCRDEGFERVYLETTDGLEISSRMYEKRGFVTTSTERIELWEGVRPLIRMEKALS